MTRPLFIAIAIFGILVGGRAGEALAETLGPFSAVVPVIRTDWTNGTLSFPQFNPALGTLTAVTITLSGTLDTTLTVTNQGSSNSSGSATTEVQVSVLDTDNDLAGDSPQLDFFSASFPYRNLGPGDSVESGLLTAAETSTFGYTDAGTLGEFTGTGDISLTGSTVTYTLLRYTGGNTDATQVTSAGLDGLVTYTYSAIVPEPGTLWLALAGLVFAGLAVAIRRR